MIRNSPPTVTWHEHHQARTVALNVGGRYVALLAEVGLGLVMLPFNTRYLGASEYGLWMLAASIVAYFSMLDLGFGGAMERYVARYRAHRDARAINEIASTLIVVFGTFGLLALAVAAGIGWHLGSWFDLPAAQARTGGIVVLLVGLQFAFGFPFAVFGAVCNGFQRTYLNAIVGTAVAVTVSIVNVVVLLAGGGLVELIVATTATRLFGCIAYRLNAYRVFPLLHISVSLFSRARLRELSSFSVYMLIQDVSNKLAFAHAPIIVAAFLMTGAVAVWTVAQRLSDVLLQLTNQLNYVLFPIVVDCDTAQRNDRLRELLIQGTRISLASTLPAAGTLALLAGPVVVGWTGPEFRGAAAVLEILALVVLVRVGSATAGTVLAGAGHHRLLAISNLAAAITNIALSVLLIRRYGLPGVAFATLVPATVRALIVLFPVACARVGMSLPAFAMQAIWPAAWPAALVLGGLALVRESVPHSLIHAVLLGVCVTLVYAALFLGVAIGREDRARYVGKLRSIAGRPVLEAA